MSAHLVVDASTSVELRSQGSSVPGRLGWAIVFGLCALLIFGVLAFGAVDEWSTFAFEAGAAVLFLVWAGNQVVSRQVKLSKNPLHLPAFLFFGLILAQVALR